MLRKLLEAVVEATSVPVTKESLMIIAVIVLDPISEQDAIRGKRSAKQSGN
jgi:hypothetical protein